MWTEETKKFRVYLRLASQISNKLIPGSSVSHNEKSITITKEVHPNVDISNIENKTQTKEIDFRSLFQLTKHSKNKINIYLYIISYK